MIAIFALWKNANVSYRRGFIAIRLFFMMAMVAGLISNPVRVFSAEIPDVVFERSELTIHTDGGRHQFNIEIAKTEPARMRGLMQRRHMKDDAGMLFIYTESRRLFMWMKNTFISLDMLFIDSLGNIKGIVANTTPMSLKIIASPGLALAVLELKGGTAARLDIKVGDTVEHQVFHP